MTKKKVIILGATGMLGSMLLDRFALSKEIDLKVKATYRRPKEERKLLKKQYPQVSFYQFDVEKTRKEDVAELIKGCQWVINAIGVTKPHIHENNDKEIERAIIVNAFFPHLLAYAAKKTNSKVLQIATDCVYSGQKGRYTETDAHDCLDVYGKTKSLGEVKGDKYYHLRCSIIGSEQKGHHFLLDWFLTQPKKARINGFINHQWNGITSLHFARICLGIVKKEIALPHLQHILPANRINKAELIKIIAKEFKRQDVIIRGKKAPVAIDRTLSTKNKRLNQRIWRLAGYPRPPTIAKMIKELSQL